MERRKKNFNIIGYTFGELTVTAELERRVLPSGQKARMVACRCACGNTSDVLVLHLIRGRIISCGCKLKTVNGESGTPIGRAWRSMIQRCSPTYFDKHLYFNKGITVCNEWKENFPTFKSWALNNGFQKGLVLDRRENSKGYSPDNCRFVTAKINANNTDLNIRVDYKGESIPLHLLMQQLGISDKHYPAIRGRIKRGWSGERAVLTPIRQGKYKQKVYDLKHLKAA